MIILKIHLAGYRMRNSNFYLLCLYLIFTSINLFGQTLPRMKVNSKDTIYKSTVGGDIKIELNLNAADPTLISLKCSLNPAILKQSDSVYIVRFQTLADEAKLKLYYKNLPIEIKTYKIEDLPLPSFVVDGSKTEIKKKVLNDKRQHTLEWDPTKDFEKSNFRIYNAKVVLAEEGKAPIIFQMRQPELPQQIYNLLPSMKSGSSITISDINFINNYGNVFLTPGTWTFKVVE
jgi:hypothetical protein